MYGQIPVDLFNFECVCVCVCAFLSLYLSLIVFHFHSVRNPEPMFMFIRSLALRLSRAEYSIQNLKYPDAFSLEIRINAS